MRYVAGLLFDDAGLNVVLIHKNHGPARVTGRWNAIGGRIKADETSLEAMNREFKEEAGVSGINWTFFMQLQGHGWTVDFYHAHNYSAFRSACTCEGELVDVWPVANLPGVVTNLHWIIPMALDHGFDHVPVYRITEVEDD